MKIQSKQSVNIELTEEELMIILVALGEAVPSKVEKNILISYDCKVDGLRVHDMYNMLEDFYDSKIKQ